MQLLYGFYEVIRGQKPVLKNNVDTVTFSERLQTYVMTVECQILYEWPTDLDQRLRASAFESLSH